MMVHLVSSTFHLSYKGEHAVVKTFGARKNSSLSWAQEKDLKMAIDQGSKPGEVLVSWLKGAVAQLEAKGQDPLDHKMDAGGLEGE